MFGLKFRCTVLKSEVSLRHLTACKLDACTVCSGSEIPLSWSLLHRSDGFILSGRFLARRAAVWTRLHIKSLEKAEIFISNAHVSL